MEMTSVFFLPESRNAGAWAGTQNHGAHTTMMNRFRGALLGAILCAWAWAAPADGLDANAREFTNLTLGQWTLRLKACRPGGGVEVFSMERSVARLAGPGAEFRFPVQEGVEVRYRSWTDIRFALVDGRGRDGGVEFQVGRDLELIPVGGDDFVLDRVVDYRLLRLGHLDLMEPEWPDEN